MPDSLPNSPTKEPPVGGSDLTVPGTFVNNSLTVSKGNRNKKKKTGVLTAILPRVNPSSLGRIC